MKIFKHNLVVLLMILEFNIRNVCTNSMDNENYIIYKTLIRQKRKLPLIFHDFGVSQYVCGFGIPVDSDYFESVTSGIVFKSQLPLPATEKELRNHTTHNVNAGRRSMDASNDEQILNKHIRWEFYKMLELWADSMGFNGRACVLKTLCEVSQIPFANDTGDLWHEVAHILFTPFSSLDVLTKHWYNEYLAASNIGLTAHTNCDHIFKECPKSILKIFTTKMSCYEPKRNEGHYKFNPDYRIGLLMEKFWSRHESNDSISNETISQVLRYQEQIEKIRNYDARRHSNMPRYTNQTYGWLPGYKIRFLESCDLNLFDSRALQKVAKELMQQYENHCACKNLLNKPKN